MTTSGVKRKHEMEKRINFLQYDLYTDVMFRSLTVTDYSYIGAHKFILASASDVFEKMFYGSLPESSKVYVHNEVEEDQGEEEDVSKDLAEKKEWSRKKILVEIENIQLKTFQLFLRYL